VGANAADLAANARFDFGLDLGAFRFGDRHSVSLAEKAESERNSPHR
jgi:hypothetical protein